MKKLSKKELFAVVLLGGLGVVVYIQYARGAFSGHSQAEAVRAAVKEVEAAGLPTLVDVTLAQPSEVRIRDNSRNLFNYARSPDQVAEEKRLIAEAERQAREAAERRRLQVEAEAKATAERIKFEAVHPPALPAPPINFRFIGKMGASRTPLAVLEEVSPGGERYVVREGEVILDKYKILKIEFDSVTIGYTNPLWAQETKTIKMGG